MGFAGRAWQGRNRPAGPWRLCPARRRQDRRERQVPGRHEGAARELYLLERIERQLYALAARRILKHLASDPRASLFILLDERRDRQVCFPRFGRDLPPSGNLSVALRLGRKVNARFLPFYLARTDGPHFRLHWHPPLDPLSMSDAAIFTAVDAYLGAASIAHADQWLALHDMDLTAPDHAPAIASATPEGM